MLWPEGRGRQANLVEGFVMFSSGLWTRRSALLGIVRVRLGGVRRKSVRIEEVRMEVVNMLAGRR